MRKLIALGIAVCLLALFSLPALAAGGGAKGTGRKAYEHASDNAMFNRVNDWFATRGKSEEEKEAIIRERKARRVEKRVEKEARKAKKKAEREAKRAEKKAREKVKGASQ